ncbi:AAA family ATPase [Sediminibacterium sp.]|uniref:AAA family ATPase n=1 Tax=Sediminibacterium sp. TaxID=1917865 RepID=UPI002736AF74|nr:AAA family ATPase [Sediminibacterium sp.]MDP3394226.1 AAA family ATPase [Sediminibacterium sp.]MDP3567084.1 AAA family ATPase [Sediminibacterium sp.]
MKRLKSIEVKKSPFFEDIKIDFSEKLNCIMGGRGTGKSTLLYLIKSAIFKDAEEERNVYNILKTNLGTGEITLELEASDGAFYRVTKTFNDEPQPYKYPNSEYFPIDKIFEDIECDFYETGKIEEIGRSAKDRLQLLDKKVKSDLKEFELAIRQLQIDLDANAQDIKIYNLRVQRIEESLNQYTGIEEEFEAQRNHQPAGLKEEEKKEFEVADIKEKYRKSEKRAVGKLIDGFSELRNEFEQKKQELNELLIRSQIDKESFINKEIMDGVLSHTEAAIKSMQENITSIAKSIGDVLTQLDSSSGKLTEAHELQQAEFVKVKQKFEEHREYINKYHLLSKRLNEKETLKKDKQELGDKRSKLKLTRTILVKKLNDLKQAIFKIRLNAITELNKAFEGAIIINLTFSGITAPFEDKLREALKGSGLRYNELIPRIVETFSSDEFASVIHIKDIEKLRTITGIDIARAESLINALHETEAIYEIERMYLDDLPEFKLRINEGGVIEENYRRSEELSMGQRCTTVLPIIFAVSENPLIIDQPEDNLDNKYISGKIHEIIRKQKEERQLILITHNPNIPVLSESEYNVFLKFDRKSSIDAVGTVNEVKNKIIELLEGGESAFIRRKDTYGY